MEDDIHKLYKKETGKEWCMSASDKECGLAIYIEAPSEHYLRWLEKRAATGGAPAEQTGNSQSMADA